MTVEQGTVAMEWLDGAELRRSLHDLSQPLTALECILYLQMVTAEQTIPDGTAAAAVSNSMREALVECSRMMTVMKAMRECLEGPVEQAPS